MSKLRRILSWLALAVCFAVLCVFLWRNVTDLLDSDMASDMIYADLLRQEGSLLSSNWYYSSEIRILSNHLFFTPLFYLTRDWHLVRFLGTALSYVLLLLSLWTVTRQVGLRRWFPLIGAALLLPLSIAYTHYSLVGTFYMPHHILAFFLFALTLSQSAPCTPAPARCGWRFSRPSPWRRGYAAIASCTCFSFRWRWPPRTCACGTAPLRALPGC